MGHGVPSHPHLYVVEEGQPRYDVDQGHREDKPVAPVKLTAELLTESNGQGSLYASQVSTIWLSPPWSIRSPFLSCPQGGG